MKVDSSDVRMEVSEKVASQAQNKRDHFPELLNKRLSDRQVKVKPMSQIVPVKNDSVAAKTGLVHVGTITKRTPTVSNLLIEHSAYGKDTWHIIYSEKNRMKPYTEIRPGTDIYLDPDTHELLWNHMVSQKESDTMEKTGDTPEKSPAFIELGMITQDNPTVSHLLKHHPDYRQTTYPIIHSAINQDKPYTRMVEGTWVYLNPATLELLWNSPKSGHETELIAHNKDGSISDDRQPIPNDPDPFSENLVKSVSHFVGSSYDEMDCFELLVCGLNKMGVNYSGRGGLYDHLVKMAVTRGMPENAYLNGEGLIEASGTPVYVKSMVKIDDAKAQADKVYQEMEPLLNKGFVLSFSTPTRGHTGIVSQRDHLWTYINSGTMDHRLGGRHNPKGVGEEILAEEIKNWVTRAANKRQPLKITLGRLDAQKLLRIEA